MDIEIKQLHPRFVGEIVGLDTSGPLSPEAVEFLEDAMAKYAVCVVRDFSLGDENHMRFARAFGPMEFGPPNTRITAGLYDIGNLDANGEIIPEDPDAKAKPTDFELFHTDSPFNSLPTKWSMLLAYDPPPVGANTEYVDTRAVYADLPEDMKAKVEHLVVDHDLFQALLRNGVEFGTDEMRKAYPRMAHPLVRTAANGSKALYMGWHGVRVEGWSEEDSHKLLDELYAIATQPKYVYSHKWRVGDMVIWDNRCTMHSATSFERYKYKRDMRRITINEYGPEVSTIEAMREAAQ